MAISTPRRPTTALQNVNGERRRGEVTFWIDDTYCLICDLDAGEDFYFSRNMLIYPQAINKVRETGTKGGLHSARRAWRQQEARAAGVLAVGEYYKGVLMSLRPGRRHGWLRLQDSLGNPHLVYLRVNSNAEGHKDVTRAEEDEAA